MLGIFNPWPLCHLTNCRFLTFLQRQFEKTKKIKRYKVKSIISLQSLQAMAKVNIYIHVTTNEREKSLLKSTLYIVRTILYTWSWLLFHHQQKKSVEEPRIEVCDFGDIRCVLGHVIHVVESMDPQGTGPHHGSVRCHLTLSLPPYTLCSLNRNKITVIDCGMRLIVPIWQIRDDYIFCGIMLMTSVCGKSKIQKNTLIMQCHGRAILLCYKRNSLYISVSFRVCFNPIGNENHFTIRVNSL